MTRSAHWLLPLALLLVFMAAPAPPVAAHVASQPPTQLRVVNALPSVPVFDVLVDGAPRVPGLAFGADPPLIPLPPGVHTVVAMPPGGVPAVPIVSTETTVAPGISQTLFAIQGEGLPPAFLVLPEVPPGTAGEGAAARFVHASPNTPPVDLAIAGGPVLFGNVAFGEASPYVPVTAGTVHLEARLAGTTTVVLDIPPVVLAPGGVYTFGALGLTDGAPPLGFISLTDL